MTTEQRLLAWLCAALALGHGCTCSDPKPAPSAPAETEIAMAIRFVDATTGLPLPQVTVDVRDDLGAPFPALLDSEGSSFPSRYPSGGLSSMLVSPAVPLPVRLVVRGSADGYLSSQRRVTVRGPGVHQVEVRMVKLDSPPPGVHVTRERAGRAGPSGIVEAPVSVRVGTVEGGEALVALPAGTRLLDREGEPLSGELTVQVVEHDPTTPEALASLASQGDVVSIATDVAESGPLMMEDATPLMRGPTPIVAQGRGYRLLGAVAATPATGGVTGVVVPVASVSTVILDQDGRQASQIVGAMNVTSFLSPGSFNLRERRSVRRDDTLNVVTTTDSGVVLEGGARVASVEEGGGDGDAGALLERRAACPSGETQCNDACVDLNADVNNCGRCGRRCNGVCQDGLCRATCDADRTSCSGACIATTSNRRHCGACGNSCPPAQACDLGQCTCGPGRELCGASCVSLDTDPRNCGTCGNDCGPGSSCSGGTCSCGTGRTQCGTECADLRTSDSHCGNCFQACPEGRQCKDSECVPATGTRLSASFSSQRPGASTLLATMFPRDMCSDPAKIGVRLPDAAAYPFTFRFRTGLPLPLPTVKVVTEAAPNTELVGAVGGECSARLDYSIDPGGSSITFCAQGDRRHRFGGQQVLVTYSGLPPTTVVVSNRPKDIPLRVAVSMTGYRKEYTLSATQDRFTTSFFPPADYVLPNNASVDLIVRGRSVLTLGPSELKDLLGDRSGKLICGHTVTLPAPRQPAPLPVVVAVAGCQGAFQGAVNITLGDQTFRTAGSSLFLVPPGTYTVGASASWGGRSFQTVDTMDVSLGHQAKTLPAPRGWCEARGGERLEGVVIPPVEPSRSRSLTSRGTVRLPDREAKSSSYQMRSSLGAISKYRGLP